MAQWLPYAEWREKKRRDDLLKLTPEARAEFLAGLDEPQVYEVNRSLTPGRTRAANRPKQFRSYRGTTAEGADTRP